MAGLRWRKKYLKKEICCRFADFCVFSESSERYMSLDYAFFFNIWSPVNKHKYLQALLITPWCWVWAIIVEIDCVALGCDWFVGAYCCIWNLFGEFALRLIRIIFWYDLRIATLRRCVASGFSSRTQKPIQYVEVQLSRAGLTYSFMYGWDAFFMIFFFFCTLYAHINDSSKYRCLGVVVLSWLCLGLFLLSAFLCLVARLLVIVTHLKLIFCFWIAWSCSLKYTSCFLVWVTASLQLGKVRYRLNK